MSIFCTSGRFSIRCSRRVRKAAASSSMRVWSSMVVLLGVRFQHAFKGARVQGVGAPSETGAARGLLQDRGKAARPCGLSVAGPDKVVAQFQQRVGPLMGDRVAGDGIAGK